MPERMQQVTSGTPNGLVRRRGLSTFLRTIIGFLVSVFTSAISFAVAMVAAGNSDNFVVALIGGAFNGALLWIFFALAAYRRQFWPAVSICYLIQAAATIGAAILIPYSTITGSIIMYNWGGFVIGAFLILLFGPREMVYRYARCPGCKYNLALLPKSDVCPECGRDNTDLVEIFADIRF